MSNKSRTIIVETLGEMSRGMSIIRYVREDFEEMMDRRYNKKMRQLTVQDALDLNEECK